MACLSRSPSHASTTCGSSTHSGHNNACFGGLSTPPPPKTASALTARSDALHRYNGSIDDDQRCGGSCSASRSMRQVRWRKGGGYGVPCSPVLGVGVAGRGCRPRSSRRQPPPPHARDVRDTDARALVDALGVPRVESGAACAAANDACMRTACLVSGVRVAVGGARPHVRASAGAVAAACARRVRRRHRAGGVRLRRGGPAFACGPRARRPPPTAAVVVAVVLAFVGSPSRRRRAARRGQRLWVRRGVVVSNRLSLTESSRILSQHRTESFTACSRTQVGACRPFAPAREPPHYEIYTCERRDERSDDNRDSKSGS